MTFVTSYFDPSMNSGQRFAQYDLEPGSPPQGGFDLEPRADQVRAFVDSQQAEMSIGGKICRAVRYDETIAIVAYFHLEF